MNILAIPRDPTYPYPRVDPKDLVETDGVPLESDWHRRQMNLLIDSIDCLLSGRDDYYVGGNMFIYYSEEQVRNKDYRGPDFFYVEGASREPMRPYWAAWLEGGRLPNTIIELMSPTTSQNDLTTKKEIYRAVFRTGDYFCYDPDTHELFGWHLVGHRYNALVPNERGWLWCEELQLWLGTWEGHQGRQATWLRFFDKEGRLVPTLAEAALQQADTETERADSESKRADSESKRADNAERELAELRAKLAEKNNPPS